MSTEPEQIEIEVTDQPAVEKEELEIVKAEEQSQEPSKVKEIEPEEGLEALKKRLEEERSARINAEKLAQEAAQRAYQASNEVQDVNLQLVKNAIDTLHGNARTLKSEYSSAMAMGDYDRAAELQESMSENTAKLLQLEQGKTALENQPKQKAPEPVYSDPVEKLASQLTPRSAEWIRRNPDFARNPRMYQKMIAAHNLVTADEVRPDTDEYFSRVESILGVGGSDSDDSPMSSASKPTQKRSPPAAPVSRSGTGTGTRPNVVRLTAQEREIASMMGMTDQDYARNKLALQKEGKLN